MTDDESLRAYFAFDWAYFGHYDRLHAPLKFEIDLDGWCATDVTFACGRAAERAYLPGFGSRLACRRCSQCCDALGLPRGKGSPKNDDACRAILGMDERENS